jgi:hypothetical protein
LQNAVINRDISVHASFSYPRNNFILEDARGIHTCILHEVVFHEKYACMMGNSSCLHVLLLMESISHNKNPQTTIQRSYIYICIHTHMVYQSQVVHGDMDFNTSGEKIKRKNIQNVNRM